MNNVPTKITLALTIGLTLSACQSHTTAFPAPAPKIVMQPQADNTPTSPEKASLVRNVQDIEKCRTQLNELQFYNKKAYIAGKLKLNKITKTQTMINASSGKASDETIHYIAYLNNLSLNETCKKIEKDLNAGMLRKALAASL